MISFLKDPTSGLYVPEGGYERITKEEYERANFSTHLDICAFARVIGLAFAALQVVYGIFELLGGLFAGNYETCLDGLRDIVRGGVQMVPIIGCLCLFIFDEYTGYRKDKRDVFETTLETKQFKSVGLQVARAYN